MTPKDQPRHGEVAPDPALARARDVAFEISCDLIGSADAENRAECERFVMLSAGAGHLLLLGWGVALVLRGLL